MKLKKNVVGKKVKEYFKKIAPDLLIRKSFNETVLLHYYKAVNLLIYKVLFYGSNNYNFIFIFIYL